MKQLILDFLGLAALSGHKPLSSSEIESIITKEVKRGLKSAFADTDGMLFFCPHDFSSLRGKISEYLHESNERIVKSTVQNMVDEYISDESFIDDIVERILKKQLVK